jgi:predicted acyl esterase
MKVEKNIHVKMRDGVRVACDIYRPDAEGEFPAVFGMSPYGKDYRSWRY